MDKGLTFGLLRSSLLDDQLIEPKLLSSTFKHTLLDATLSNEAEDINLFRLSYSVGAIHGLKVSLRIPGVLQASEATRQHDTEDNLPIAVV